MRMCFFLSETSKVGKKSKVPKLRTEIYKKSEKNSVLTKTFTLLCSSRGLAQSFVHLKKVRPNRAKRLSYFITPVGGFIRSKAS